MERSLGFFASLALGLCLCGCTSERRPDKASAPRAGGDEHSGRHVVVRPVDPIPTTDAPPLGDALSPNTTALPLEPTAGVPPETYLPPSGDNPTFEPGSPAPPGAPPVGSVESNIRPPQSGGSQPLAIEAQFDRAMNPLRTELVSPSYSSNSSNHKSPLVPRTANPLRSFSQQSEGAGAFPAAAPQYSQSGDVASAPNSPAASHLTQALPNDSTAAEFPAAALWPEAHTAAPLRRGTRAKTAAEPTAALDPSDSLLNLGQPRPDGADPLAGEPRESLPRAAEPAAEQFTQPAVPVIPRKNLQSISGLGPLPAEPIGPPPATLPYDTVQVFYGTNRAAVDLSRLSPPEQVARWLPTAVAALITVALAMLAIAKGRTSALVLASLGLVASLGLAYQAASSSLYEARRGGHLGPKYTADRAPGGRVELGLCEVTIPRSHTVGELEAPSILRMEVRSDSSKHVVLSKTEPLADEKFYELLRERVAASPRKEVFVFVHGFNVTFEDAARRAGQMHHDLKYQGVPVFFSWPAHDKFVLTYTADANNVSWSASHLKQFLLDITARSDAEAVNLIAHSMGNRALTAALKELHLELRDQSRLFNQVILAAPDIDADEFRHSIAPALAGTANRITLYASSRDEALAASQLVHRGPRAGDAGRGLVVVPGIDTIDVSPIDSSPWGHTYYGSSDPVLRDLGMLIMTSTPPEQRTWLAPAELEGLPYWIFQPPAATARVPREGPLPAQR
jgi:esterase/lipase superfamily enzyme